MFRKSVVLSGLRISAVVCLFVVTMIAVLNLSGCGGSSSPVSVAVTASAATVDATDAVTLTAAVTNDKNSGGVTWSVSGGGTLSNTSTTGATYTAPAASSSALSVIVTATSVADTTKTGTATLTVPAAPAVTTGALAAAAVGTAYSQPLAASGGIPPYAWTITSGTLPTCMTMNAAGVISGAPTASCVGTANLTFKVTDSGTATALSATSASLGLTVNAAPAITFTGLVPATATYESSAPYAGFASATGGAGALTYSLLSGAFPPGIGLLSTANGQIGGTPTAVGTYSFTIKAVDAFGDSGTQAYSIVVSYPALTITSPVTLPVGYAGAAYSQTLSATGGSGTGYTWTVTGGAASLAAANLSLSSGGVLTGAPSAASAPSFTVKVTDSASNTASATLTVNINPGLSITTGTTLPAGYGGTAYSQTLAASGGSGTGLSWSVTSGASSLTAVGLSLSSGGILSGTTPIAGSASFGVKVTDSVSNTTTATFSVTINPGLAITTAATLPAAYGGTAYSQTLASSGGTGTGLSWTVTSGSSSLTAVGLSLSSGGVLSGATPITGSASFTVKVTDSASNAASQTFSVTVGGALTVTSPATLPTGYVGTAYSQTLTSSGGTGTGLTWTVTSGSPATVGLTLSSGGVLSGATPIVGSASFSVKLTDSASNTATATLSVTISPGLTITTGTTLPAGYGGTAYTQTLAASGGSGSGLAWTVTSGSPAAVGLSLSSGGVLSGAAPIAGSASFTVKVTDSASNTATATFSVTINPGLVITTAAALPAGYAGTAYSQTLVSSGGTGTGLTWTVTSGSSAAVGLSLSSGGVLSGATPIAGSASFTVKVTDSAGNAASQTFSVTINSALTITTGTTLPAGFVGTAYSQTLASTGGTGTGLTWTITSGGTSLTAIGLSLSSGGVLTGPTPTAGSASFTVKVMDSASNTASQTFSINVGTGLTITTGNPLPGGYVGTAYSQTLASTGGTGTGLSWTVTSGGSSLTAVGLSLSSGGVLSGATPIAGGASFSVKVTDSASNTATATFSVTISPGLTITTAATLPVGYAGVNYSQTLTSSGGTGSGLTWTVTSGNSSLAAVGLSLSSGGLVSGATPIAGSASFTVKVTDSASNAASQTFSVTINGALTITSPTTLPGGNVGVSYSQALTSSGGSGSGLNWTVTSGGSSLAAVGLSLTGGGVVSGATPIAGSASFTVMVMDSASNTASQTFSVTISPGQQVSGQVFLNNFCGSPSVPEITVKLYSSPGGTLLQTVTTDNSNGNGTGNGNYTFASVPNGNYTITPSIAGAGVSSLFYPANLSVTVNNSNQTTENFGAALGYTVSGTVSYTTGGTAQTGQTYLALQNSSCGGSGGSGTSITESALTSGGAFTIRGVAPGSYTLLAWMDPLGQGLTNAIDPSGNSPVTVLNANVSNAAVTMTNPTFATPTEDPTISGVIPNAQGVLIPFSPSTNSSGIEDANQYTVQWSTSPTIGGGSGGGQFASIAGSHTFTASGDKGVWVLNNAVLGAGTFASGQTYYFQARSFNTLDTANPHPTGWCNYTSTGCSGTTGFVGVTIGTPACTGTCTAVSSSVTIPAGIVINTGAPLYLGLIQLSSAGGNPIGFYVTEIANPVNGVNQFPAPIAVPSGSNYAVIGILDQNKDGGFDAGAVTNTNDNLSANLTISGSSQTVPGITLPATNSTVQVQTQYMQSTSPSGSSTNYQLNFDLRESNKLPVAVTLTSGPNVIAPVDISNYCQNCGNAEFQYSATLPGGTPNVGDTYDFTVTYSDGTQDTGTTVNGAVTGWNGTSSVVGASDIATNLSPVGNGSNTQPTFTWTYPASASSYTYSFYLCCANNSNVWQIPGNNSKSNGFTSSQIPAASIPWSTTTDPTGASNAPTVTSLTGATQYNWSIQVQDNNGNQAVTQVNYTP